MSAQEYRYGCVHRPPGIGAVPKGPFRVEPSLTELSARSFYTRHGVIVYERELTEQELVSFELAVIANATLRDEMARQVAGRMRRYALPYLRQAETEPDQFAQAVMALARETRSFRVYLGPPEDFVERVKVQLRGDEEQRAPG